MQSNFAICLGLRIWKKKLRDLIYNVIVQAGNKGITKGELLKILPALDQSTVYRIALKLEKEGAIKIERIGQRTRYVALRKPLRDFAVEGFLYGTKFTNGILGTKGLVSFDPLPWDSEFEPSDPRHPDYALYRDYKSSSRFFTTSLPPFSLEGEIFEFVNQLGVFMLSVFSNAMNYRNIAKFKTTRNEDINRLVMTYVRNAIGAKLNIMLWKFWFILNRWWILNKGDRKEVYDRLDNKKELMPLFEEEVIDTIQSAVAGLYPRLLKRLEDKKISDYDIDQFLESHANMLQRERERDECTHPEYIACRTNIVRKRGKNFIKLKCAECRRWVTRTQPHRKLDWTDPYKMADM